MLKKVLPYIISFILINGNSLFAQNYSYELSNYFSDCSNNGLLNGNIAVIKDNNVLLNKSFGYSDFDHKIFLDEDYLFPLASVSKIFTAICIFQLRDAGKLALDDSVVKFIPDFPYSNICIKHLLSHTSGLRDYEVFVKAIPKQNGIPFTNLDVLTVFKENKPPLLFEPGTKFKYSNIAYNILANVIESVSGISFNSFLNKMIFKNANMKNTFLFNDIPANCKKVNLYRYKYSFSSSPIIIDSIDDRQIQLYQTYFNNFYGSDGLWSSIKDLLKFFNSLASGKILSPKSLNDATTPFHLKDGNIAAFKNNSLGITYSTLGFFLLKNSQNSEIIFHSGSNPGIETSFFINLKKNEAVVILSNRQDETINVQALAAMNILDNLPYLFPKKSLAKLYAQLVMVKPLIEVVSIFDLCKTDTLNYFFNEVTINDVGYELLGAKYIEPALELFKINTQLFPNSSNCFDSYAEALALAGENDEAIKNYEKALSIDPNKKSSIDGLKQLKEQRIKQ